MTGEQIVGLILALVVMWVGLVGSLLPIFPGTLWVFATALFHRLYFGPAGPSTWVLLTMAGFVLLSMGLDFVAGLVGARKLGASRWGIWGAIVGGVVGLFFSLPGLLLGPFLGAFLFERLGGRPFREAAKAGLGALLGLLAGAVGKFACCLLMMAMFTVSVVLRAHAQAPVEALAWMAVVGR
jgi:uncharacterized protein YqgC (DUF456 family)